jgi:hypothetical protein
MPVVFLNQPFMFHHAGSVFDLSPKRVASDRDGSDMNNEKMSPRDKWYYPLPDSGKGEEAQLSLFYTTICPESLYKNIDLKSGPCRITSVSTCLQKTDNDPYYAHPLPLGRGRVLVGDSPNYLKNMIRLDVDAKNSPDQLIFINRISGLPLEVEYDQRYNAEMLAPGFYRCELFRKGQLLHYFTMIKCFPIVVTYQKNNHSYDVSTPLW